MTSKYLFLSSTDSMDVHPSNNFSDFTVELHSPLDLNEELHHDSKWSVALTDISVKWNKSLDGTVIVLCDLVECNYIKGEQIPLLRTLPGAALDGISLHLPYYMQLKNLVFSSLRIYLVDENLEKLKFEQDNNIKLTCTLHFQSHL
jgi:hypothetical protein